MENLTDRQKRLLWHASHRGMQELDILMGNMTKKHIKNMDEKTLNLLESFLEVDDAEVWHWLTEKKPIHPDYDNIIWQWLLIERGEI